MLLLLLLYCLHEFWCGTRVHGDLLGCEEVKGGSRALVTAILFLETLFLSFSWNFIYIVCLFLFQIYFMLALVSLSSLGVFLPIRVQDMVRGGGSRWDLERSFMHFRRSTLCLLLSSESFSGSRPVIYFSLYLSVDFIAIFLFHLKVGWHSPLECPTAWPQTIRGCASFGCL